jgi:peptidoglycan hydrolase-like protein with peptidoglycan-binding domain
MADQLYPTGYGTPVPQRTMAQNEARGTVAKLHPEMWRRFKALMEAAATAGVGVGVGTGWRVQPVNPDGTAKPGFALPGNSNHEGFPADGVTGGAVAIDAVGDLAWMEKNLARFGLRSFNRPSTWGYGGNDEAWHVQPVEIPASRNKRKTPWTLPTWNLPGVPSGPPLIVDAPPASLELGSTNVNNVRWLQQIMNERWNAGLSVDGQFGPGTLAAVKKMQAVLGRTPDGVYGPRTALALAAWLSSH